MCGNSTVIFFTLFRIFGAILKWFLKLKIGFITCPKLPWEPWQFINFGRPVMHDWQIEWNSTVLYFFQSLNVSHCYIFPVNTFYDHLIPHPHVHFIPISSIFSYIHLSPSHYISCYCTISFNSSGTLTRDAPDKNMISSSCSTEHDLIIFFVKHPDVFF